MIEKQKSLVKVMLILIPNTETMIKNLPQAFDYMYNTWARRDAKTCSKVNDEFRIMDQFGELVTIEKPNNLYPVYDVKPDADFVWTKDISTQLVYPKDGYCGWHEMDIKVGTKWEKHTEVYIGKCNYLYVVKKRYFGKRLIVARKASKISFDL